jgi:Fe-S-cluster containining protein
MLAAVDGAEHLDFACNGCGDCCRRHRVALTHLDLARLRRAVSEPMDALVAWLPPDQVDLDAESASFVALPEGPRLMVLAHAGRGCRFLTPDDRCRVYAVRPRDCELYPFVLERNEERKPVRLALFQPEGCGDKTASRTQLEDLEHADATRWAELDAYRERVTRWNRLGWHRRRLGRRTGTAAEFLDFALRDSWPDVAVR